MTEKFERKPVIKGGRKSNIVPEVQKPKCAVHHKPMVYVPHELVWKCIMPGCRMVSRVTMLGEARPTILRGGMRYFVYEDTGFILFNDSSLLYPVSELPEGSVVDETKEDGFATITIRLKVQEVE